MVLKRRKRGSLGAPNNAQYVAALYGLKSHLRNQKFKRLIYVNRLGLKEDRLVGLEA